MMSWNEGRKKLKEKKKEEKGAKEYEVMKKKKRLTLSLFLTNV